MHVGGITVDLNWLIQLILTLFAIAIGLLHLIKNTASKYFEVDANFEGDHSTITADRNHAPPPMELDDSSCANCGKAGKKRCSRCKSARYCSTECQQLHWKSGHKSKCKDFAGVNSIQIAKTRFGFKSAGATGRSLSGIALVPSNDTTKPIKKPGEILFPYDEFIELYNWDKAVFPPCGLLNCGNSCFANVVLQCLTFTRPLVAYLLEKGHQRECRLNDWCFLCEFQAHVERASKSLHPFSPMSILSRLPNIGGNLGYGRQEDAHEFMRFAIDTMQSVCLDEFGGEKAVDPASQETTVIQHIFGGHLQSQVICTKCNKISNQLENMMDLTVEIHGDAASLEECLDQFTAEEQLHGENMYKCDGCNEYVKAWKRLTIRRVPNILTIALKRFQSGRFGKLNKRVAFPEILDLSPYTSEEGDGNDVYRLYAVVVHVDMLNASFFGHYICYIKDFSGKWYRVDDCKVRSVELEEVLSQGAYMFLYNRISARPSCLRTIQHSKEQQPTENVELGTRINGKVDYPNKIIQFHSDLDQLDGTNSLEMSEIATKCGMAYSSAVSSDGSSCEIESSSGVDSKDMDNFHVSGMLEVFNCDRDVPIESNHEHGGEHSAGVVATDSDFNSSVPVKASGSELDSCSSKGCEEVVMEDLADTDQARSCIAKDAKVNGTVYSFSGTAASAKPHHLKHNLPLGSANDDNNYDRNGAEGVEITDVY